jgi:hypothetical protein
VNNPLTGRSLPASTYHVPSFQLAQNQAKHHPKFPRTHSEPFSTIIVYQFSNAKSDPWLHVQTHDIFHDNLSIRMI